MDTEQPAADSDVLDRMSNFFSPAKPEGPVETEAAAPEEASVEIDDAEPIEAQDEEEAPEPAGEQLEVDGEEYVLPPKLAEKVKEWKEGALRQEDYTRKTQQVADLQRVVSQHAEAIQLSQQFEQAVSQERIELARVQSEIERYKAVDWGSLDVDSYVKLRGQFDTLKERAGELQSAIGNKSQQFQQWRSQHQQQLARAGEQYLAKAVPNWGDQAKADAVKAATAANFTEQELAQVFDPRFVALAWKAAQYDKLQTDKSATVEKAKKAPPVVKPGPGQGQTAARDRQYKDLRAQLKKTGDVRIAAKLMLMKGK